MFVAQSIMFARTIALAINDTTRGGPFFLLEPATFAVILSMVFCVVAQVYWLNQGLARFDSLYNTPMFCGTAIVGTVCGDITEFIGFFSFLFPSIRKTRL
jgi:hypothetical protein